MVTSWNPLMIWVYRKCYLRFCSEPFSLGSLDGYVHLSNNSIQKDCPTFDRIEAAQGNMWSCDRFAQYLRERIGGDPFGERIQPALERIAVRTLLAVQDTVNYRKVLPGPGPGPARPGPAVWAPAPAPAQRSSRAAPMPPRLWDLAYVNLIPFPVLAAPGGLQLQVNASPCLEHSTPITGELCPQCVEDTFRVVLDHARPLQAYCTASAARAAKVPAHRPVVGADLEAAGAGGSAGDASVDARRWAVGPAPGFEETSAVVQCTPASGSPVSSPLPNAPAASVPNEGNDPWVPPPELASLDTGLWKLTYCAQVHQTPRYLQAASIKCEGQAISLA
ncbi:putative tubulin monoglycylase TTLL3 [Paratrimastix pyriformis]|uniref:Tubulin monoglycylase TTLL3 n=1 Tax=Paratrimastix pyriformis TaxID=342808 RepID=A0ABQ8UL66_9EUKA|nr:putative tubulin monoglycylase TTLL3 [Paratrimastix pyriformis]